MLVAQKVWDDKNLSNQDFVYIYPFFTIQEMNKLEQKFLELIDYQLKVSAQFYMQYYFELWDKVKSDPEFPLSKLDAQQSFQLESRSEDIQNAQKQKSKTMNPAGN